VKPRASDGMGWASRPHPHPTHITREAIVAALEIMGFGPETHDAVTRVTIDVTGVTVLEFLTREDGARYVDPAYGEVPMCESRIMICSDEFWERQQAGLRAQPKVAVCGPEGIDETGTG